MCGKAAERVKWRSFFALFLVLVFGWSESPGEYGVYGWMISQSHRSLGPSHAVQLAALAFFNMCFVDDAAVFELDMYGRAQASCRAYDWCLFQALGRALNLKKLAVDGMLVIFAHGAGADKSHEFMEQVSRYLNDHGINVIRFNFSYMDVRLAEGNRRPPDRMPKLLECFETVIKELDTDLPVFLAGKSMGGRVAATLARDKTLNVLGVMCLGYPFHPQKKPEKIRLEPLQQTQKPILILQGTRDALGGPRQLA